MLEESVSNDVMSMLWINVLINFHIVDTESLSITLIGNENIAY